MLNIQLVRSHFPSLEQAEKGRPVVFFDNPGGTQVPRSVIDAMVDYLTRDNANLGGAYGTSERSEAMVEQTRKAAADLFGAASPDEIIFGPNMTTLTFGLSRSLFRALNPGDEIIVTRLEHDANITPWVLLARDRGLRLRWMDIDPQDCTLRLSDLENLLTDRTRLVACSYASNAVGTVNEVKTVVSMAHAVGSLVFVDAVHYAPHGPIDVQELGCDFLACSAYKFFGPHVAVLYGRGELLQRLPAYKLRPAPEMPPRKFETGTQNHEGIAGTLAAINYIADLSGSEQSGDRRFRILEAMKSIQEYERGLCHRLLTRLPTVRGLQLCGLADPTRLDQRVPTISFRMEGFTPYQVASYLGERGIFAWHGNHYALSLMERLGFEDTGGTVRVGLVHYNTEEEVDRLVEELQRISSP